MRRKPDPADRRSVLLALTPAATALLRGLHRVMADAAAVDAAMSRRESAGKLDSRAGAGRLPE